MRLITSNLHPTFSRLARTVVLALSLFDTFVAALPTAQESGLVRRELKSYELQLFCYRGDGQENRAERVLCLEFVGLGQVCSPHDLEDRWLRMQSLTIPPTVGVVHIASHSNEYIFLHLRETLSEAAECDLKEVEDERRLWKCVDHVVDVLSQTSAGLQEAEPQHVVSDAIKKTWEGHDRPIACE
ncbi:hypothetical protein EV361DRAFT_145793 [Lentinula raphanica]|nr:hypothetical protein EV361DRAFT_145793 [Lentinula raphanica]